MVSYIFEWAAQVGCGFAVAASVAVIVGAAGLVCSRSGTGGSLSPMRLPCRFLPKLLQSTRDPLQVESLAADIAAGTAGEATPQSKPVFSTLLGGKSSKVRERTSKAGTCKCLGLAGDSLWLFCTAGRQEQPSRAQPVGCSRVVAA